MIYETALLWVVLSAGYWGFFLLRRRAYPTSTFPLMMLAAAGLCGLGLLGRDGSTQWLSLAGAVGLGGGTCLILVGPLARRLARRASSGEHASLATALYEVADILQPGTGVREEKQLAVAFAKIHAGHVADAVQALQLVRDRSPPQAHRAIDEHIAMIYMTAWCWPEAIAHAEATLFGAPSGGQDGSTSPPVRDVSAPLWVELIAAYGRTGNLDRAAALLAAFESEAAGQARLAPLLHRARMVFLAMCGRLEAVRVLVTPKNSPHMTRAARRYWVGIAAVHAGQRAVAATELRQSVAAARGRARKMATAALQSCESSNPVELSNSTAAAAEFTAQQTVVSWTPLPRPWLTALGCGGCIAVTALMYCLGSTTDVATLIRAGAMVRGLVDDGQWWRLATATFVHVGPVHLFVNILGLWVIGRLAEDTFGTLRTALLFVLCGFAGASASYFASEAGISAGASGALFGLLGAVLLEYTVRRRHFAIAVRNGTWGALLVVAIATLAFGSMVPEIDQAAHVAGLLCGAVAGQLLSPRHRFGRRAAWLAVPAIGAFVALLVWGVCSIAQTNVATLMLGQPWVQRTVAGATLVAPQRWRQIEDELVDPDIYVVVAIEVLGSEAGGPDERRIMTWIEGEPARARARNFATISAAETSQIPLPASWKATEYDVAAPDSWTGSQRFRVVSFGRVDRDRVVVGSLYVPQSLVKSAAAQLSRVIASIHLESSQR